ncbi:MAG TPA: peptidoglycan DD-metalloendopeptidase family protein [Gammaproteobacteria bacterium]
MKINRLLAPLIVLVMSTPLHATTLPREAAVPGGIALVDLGSAAAQPPQATFQGKRVMVQPHEGRWWAIIGVPLATQPGKQSLKVMEAGGADHSVAFTVEAKSYTEQRLTLKNKKMVDPDPEDLKRIARDQRQSKKAFANWSNREEVQLQFATPVSGRLSSPFGLRRFFNDQPRAPHSGLDIAAPQGTEVQAPAAGTVIEVGDFYFNGKSVFIDHGQGLVTMYCHLDTIKVKKGEQLPQGAVFATVGMTGRATGPHLHWSVSLNDARIDPSLLLSNETVTALTTPQRE